MWRRYWRRSTSFSARSIAKAHSAKVRIEQEAKLFHDPDFTPFEPRTVPTFRANIRNWLENLPPSAYRDDFTTLPGLWPMVPKSNFVTDPALIEEMLVTRAEDFPRDAMTVASLSGPFSQEALFFTEGAEWKWQRRALAPAFRHENMLALVPTFAQCAAAQADAWRAASPAAPVDVMQAMSRTTFAVIERAVLGASESFDREKFVAALGPVLASIGWRRQLALFGLPPNWTPHPGYFKALASARYLNGETTRLLAARRQSGAQRRDILALLLSAKDPETGRIMTDSELVANIYGLLFAGHETSAVALGWSLWLLAKDKAWQERLREEVFEIAGDAEIGPETVEKLAFARQVIQEAMRLFPPASAVGRQPREDTTLGPYKVSKREAIYVAIWCLHRHEKLWDEPNAFDPDRFAPEKVKARHRCAYLPFGAGPRICVGMGFAMLEMTAILATLIRAFHFETVPEHRLELAPDFTTRPKGGLPLLISPVQRRAKGFNPQFKEKQRDRPATQSRIEA
jgi:cytochrome P450